MDGNQGIDASRFRVLGQVALAFLRLGATSFGGPAAHAAMMEHELVTRRGWLTREDFLDLLAATNLIPGPNSTEMAIHVGFRKAGRPGLLVAGACFILPAAILSMGIAWAYVRYGSLPSARSILYGVTPAVAAIVFQALWRLGRTALRTRTSVLVFLLSVAATVAGIHELAILLGAGILGAFVRRGRGKAPGPRITAMFVPIPKVPAVAAAALAGAGATVPYSLARLFFFFMRTGAVLFGSGYVLLAFLRADLVERWHWLTEQQLLDAIAVGQITPGPLFTTATFIGYLMGGPAGAVVATIGIFLPAFFFVAVSGPFVPRLRRSPTAASLLDGIVAASLALMTVVTWHLGRAAIVDAPTLAIACASGVALLWSRLGSGWLVLGGGLAGFALSRVA
ncbi:MAG: chromate efflux transporter [Acidobacteriota bacterium]